MKQNFLIRLSDIDLFHWPKGRAGKQRAITLKLFEREMVALSEWVYEVRYNQEERDTFIFLVQGSELALSTQC